MKLFKVKNENESSDFRRQLFADLDFVTHRLAQIRESYDMTAEPELVDALIYEELAMKSRYDYLLRVAKENNIRCKMSISD